MWLVNWSISVRDAVVLLGDLGQASDRLAKRKGMPHRTPFPYHYSSQISSFRPDAAAGTGS
jgi:hypothetical protein